MRVMRVDQHQFCRAMAMDIPIFMAPMAGACPPSLAAAVSRAGGMGACGALLMQADEIAAWADDFRQAGGTRLQLNTWVPDPEPQRDAALEQSWCAHLANWGPAPTIPRDVATPDFDAQCQAMLAARPQVISSIMGLFPSAFVAQMRAAEVMWFATVTSLAEAKAAEAAGAQALIVQGAEAGGHRGSFLAHQAERQQVGLFSLLPSIARVTRLPLIATGGIATPEQAAAAFLLGAQAVQIGTALLRSPEAGIPSAWADAIGRAAPEDTLATRAFSGRLGRALATDYAVASQDMQAAPYPVQRALTGIMRKQAAKTNSLAGMQAWAGQSAGLSPAMPAEDYCRQLWQEAQGLLPA